MKETGKIYIIKNQVNDKVYIGQTTGGIKERMWHHKSAAKYPEKMNYKLYKAMNEIGAENFFIEILEDDVPIEWLDEKEREYIKTYNAETHGYNQTPGGKGGAAFTDEQRAEIIRLSNSGKTFGELAELYGVHRATIERFLHSAGVYKTGNYDKTILELAEKGASNEEIAQEVGCHIYTVCRILDKHQKRKHKPPIKCRSGFDFDGFQRDYADLMPISEMCKTYDVSRTVFYRIVNKLGLPKRQLQKRKQK